MLSKILNPSRVNLISKSLIYRHQICSISTISVAKLFERKSIRGLEVISCQNTDTIKSAAQLMEKEKIGAVMVTKDDNTVVGILTARDVQQAVAEYDDVRNIKSEDVMTPRDKLALAKKSDSLSDIATIMMQRNIRHMPVMKGQYCEGMLSIKDVVSEVLELERKENEDLEHIITDSYSVKYSQKK
mmetsp:Transcript_74093/g.66677  ORF Transcript_74093/g.66677 Transcript_74093/m.66677 type:complete len:186 (-) Transcript_74093:9-566(-)